MNEDLFSISWDGNVIAKDIGIQYATIFIKALFEEFYAEENMELSIKRYTRED